MFDRFLDLVDPTLHARSGSVLYSGRSAFSSPSDIYLLGLNPGGDPALQSNETIGRHVDEARRRLKSDWSEYADGSWQGRSPGTWGMQPRVLHLLRRLGKDARHVPASNVVFVRSPREAALNAEKRALLTSCWRVHDEVIRSLGVRAIICFGGTAGKWVRQVLGADEPCGDFIEDNARKWASSAHRAKSGLKVVTLTHPSIADWTARPTDPSDFVSNLLKS